MMKKGEILEGYVDRLDFPNKGRILAPDGPVVVKNVLPGQKIRIAIGKARKNKYEGRLLSVIEPSPLETRAARCPVFGICGGCSYQTMRYEDQLAMKEEQVKRLIDTLSIPYRYEWEPILTSPIEWEYRNKMEFSFGDQVKDGPLMLGLHKKGSFHDIVDASRCKIVHPDYNLVLSCVLRYFSELGASFYKKMLHQGYLRHLLVRRAAKTGEMLVCLVTSSQEMQDLAPLKERLLALPLAGTLAGFLHIQNDSLADVVQSDKTEILYGQDYFFEELLGLKFKISAFSFFQNNSLGAEALYSKVREYAGGTKGGILFDLYSGTGTIAQIMAPISKKVIGVEIVEEAVRAARENAKRNGLDNCRFLEGDVFKVIGEIKEKPDLLILDPPRDGIHPKALPMLISLLVPKIIYISCNPSSLIRDLAVLMEAGYRVERMGCVDMFAHTAHCEVCVELCRKK